MSRYMDRARRTALLSGELVSMTRTGETGGLLVSREEARGILACPDGGAWTLELIDGDVVRETRYLDGRVIGRSAVMLSEVRS